MNAANLTSGQVRPETVMEAARRSVANGLEELSDAIETMAMGAAGVLTPDLPPPPETASAGQKLASIQPEHCEVVRDLHGLRQRIEQLVNRVNNIRNRLEV